MTETPIPKGSDKQVNSSSLYNQFASKVAPLADGGFVITWDSFSQDGSGYGIYGQRYTSIGIKTGPEFLVNTYTKSHQSDSAISPLTNGGFVVSWNSYNQDSDADGVFAQRYSSTGTKVDAEFQVNTHSKSHQNHSALTTLSNGDFVITWSSYDQVSSGSSIYGQRYSSNGVKIGGEFQVNSYTDSHQSDSAITALSTGGFVVTWNSYEQDGDGEGIYGQCYDSKSKHNGEFRVNSHTNSHQSASSVSPLVDGGFVVTWESYSADINNSEIHGQRYNATALKVGDEFQVNTSTRDFQTASSITSLADGGFVVIWTSYGQDGDGEGIFAQRFSKTGIALGDEFQVNSITEDNQAFPSITLLANGNLVATWSGYGEEGVFFRLIDLPSMDVETNIAPVLKLSLTASSVGEIASNGTFVGTVLATDANNDKLTYSLSDDAQGRFSIDTTTGIISVADGLALDFEKTNSHVITVSVSDGTTQTDMDYTITLNDINPESLREDTRDRTLIGGSGNDYFKTFGGADHFDGGSGKDYIDYSLSPEGVNINLSTNVISGSWAEDDTILNFESAAGSKTGDDILIGTQTNNTLRGHGGNDKLWGRFGHDKLFGGSGEDFIDGGHGNDLLFGGFDADVFHFHRGDDKDIIKDFEDDVDLIDLRKFGFKDVSKAMSYANQVNDDVVFDFGRGDTLTIEDTTYAQVIDDLIV